MIRILLDCQHKTRVCSLLKKREGSEAAALQRVAERLLGVVSVSSSSSGQRLHDDEHIGISDTGCKICGSQTLMAGKVRSAAHPRAVESKVSTEDISAVCWNETSAVEHMPV